MGDLDVTIIINDDDDNLFFRVQTVILAIEMMMRTRGSSILSAAPLPTCPGQGSCREQQEIVQNGHMSMSWLCTTDSYVRTSFEFTLSLPVHFCK